MDIHSGQHRRFPAMTIAVVLFVLCIVPGQSLVTKLLPSISGLAQINPTLIFLEIPTQLPVGIDLIVAPGLFLLIYPLVVLLYPSGRGITYRRRPLQRVRAAFSGLFVLLCCMLLGGLIYFLVQDHLTTQIRNGINSMGINADIHLSYPGHETIALRGSLVIGVCFFIGLFVFIRKIRKEPAAGLTREQRMTPYERMVQERRMQQKQPMHEPRIIQHEEIKGEGYKVDNSWKPVHMEQQTIQSDPRLCCVQPVMRLRPEAMYYMPVR